LTKGFTLELGLNLYNTGREDMTNEEVIKKANDHKTKVLNSGIWLCYLSALNVLNDLYKFGSKRGSDFTNKLNDYIHRYLNDIDCFGKELDDIYNNGKFKDCTLCIDIDSGLIK